MTSKSEPLSVGNTLKDASITLSAAFAGPCILTALALGLLILRQRAWSSK